jgi:hypothetical protein
MLKLSKLLQWRPSSLMSDAESGESELSTTLTNTWGRRRSAPLDRDRTLTSETHFWLRHVPSGLHPKRMCWHFPRIANRLARSWEDPVVTESVFDELLADKRGNRMGFPPVVVSEISRLRAFHRRRWQEMDEQLWQH